MLKRRIVAQTLVVVVVLLTIGPNAPGAVIDMTSAEQQVVGEIGYTVEGTPHQSAIQFDPVTPQDVGDAVLDVSLDNDGVLLADSLITEFSEDQVTANGSAFALAEWGSQPIGADDVHGGGGSTFTLYFTGESLPAYFYVDGQIDIDLEGYPDLHPEEVFAYVRLSSDDGGGMTLVWEETANGEGGDTSIPFAHGVWLETDTTYLLEARAESGTVASVDYSGSKSRWASYTFTATASTVTFDVPYVISNKGKSFPVSIFPPVGLDVVQMAEATVTCYLEDTGLPVTRTAVRKSQGRLDAKVSTSAVQPLELRGHDCVIIIETETEPRGYLAWELEVEPKGKPPLYAYNPSPPDGATDQPLDTDLSWQPGWKALEHEVFFGTDEADVSAGDPSAFVGVVLDPHCVLDLLDAGTTYYWKIDEISPSGTTAGSVWSFATVGP